MAAGEAVAASSGESFEAYLTRKLLAPLEDDDERELLGGVATASQRSCDAAP